MGALTYKNYKNRYTFLEKGLLNYYLSKNKGILNYCQFTDLICCFFNENFFVLQYKFFFFKIFWLLKRLLGTGVLCFFNFFFKRKLWSFDNLGGGLAFDNKIFLLKDRKRMLFRKELLTFFFLPEKLYTHLQWF